MSARAAAPRRVRTTKCVLPCSARSMTWLSIATRKTPSASSAQGCCRRCRSSTTLKTWSHRAAGATRRAFLDSYNLLIVHSIGVSGGTTLATSCFAAAAICSAEGAAFCAPLPAHARVPAATPRLMASSRGTCAVRAAAMPPMKASPAPTVSSTSTLSVCRTTVAPSSLNTTAA